MMHPSDDFLPAELSSLVEAELAKGERVVWIGQPIPALMARSSWPLVLFGVPFTGFALFWLAAAGGFLFAHGAGPPVFFALFGIPFVLIGLGMLTSPFWTFRRALRTVYAITDRRAFTIQGGPWGRIGVQSFEPASLADISRTQNADGSGNLIFQREYRPQGRNGRFVAFGFFAIPDVKVVEDLIRDLVRHANNPDGGRR